MAHTTNCTNIVGAEEIEKKEVCRTGRFLLFFKTEWWETIKTTSLGNDIYIETDRPIRNVCINNKKISLPPNN